MAERTFKSPGVRAFEIDRSGPTPTGPSGVPAGVIGTAQEGSAFVPVTVSNFSEFESKFPNLKIIYQKPLNNYLRHLLSGGLNFRQLVPDYFENMLKFIEKSMICFVVLEFFLIMSQV